MTSILVERHRLGSARSDLRTATLELGFPGFGDALLRLAIETSDELERQARTLFDR
jgi:hypothetical protein